MTSKDGWKNGMKISQLYLTLQEGIAGGGMIAYDFILPEDRLAIIHYLRSAFIPDAPQDSKDELTALDQTYNLSKGMKISPQIPVTAAKQIALSEVKIRKEKIDFVLQKITNEKTEKGAEIFLDVVKDPLKALTTLESSGEWHQNQIKFVVLVTENINNNGFSNKVNSLNIEDWDALFNYLKKTI